MKSPRLKKNACRLLLLAVVFATAALSAHSLAPPGDPGSGWWEISPENDCPDGTVCVEWTYTVGGEEVTDEACCVDPQYAGSPSYVACYSAFRHEPH